MADDNKFDELDPAKIIQEMREEYWEEVTSPEDEVDEDRFQALVARVGSELYAMPATRCKSIVKFGRVTRVPRMPDFMLGVINLRGQIVSVVDMGKFLGLGVAEDGPRTRLVVVESQGARSAFKVDEVLGIDWVDRSRVREPQAVKSSINTEYIQGHIAPDQEGDWAVYLDLDKILQGPEMFLGRK